MRPASMIRWLVFNILYFSDIGFCFAGLGGFSVLHHVTLSGFFPIRLLFSITMSSLWYFNVTGKLSDYLKLLNFERINNVLWGIGINVL